MSSKFDFNGSQQQLCASRATEYILGICNSDRASVIWPGDIKL